MLKATNCMIDWLEFSIFDDHFQTKYLTDKEKGFVKVQDNNTLLNTINLLGLDDLSFENRRGFYYKEQLVYDNCITISRGYKGNGEDNHIHVKITGKGCRFMENKLGVSNIRDEIRRRLTFPLDNGENYYKVKISRMDICRDYDEKFVLDFMSDVMHHNFSGAQSGSIFGEIGKGVTLYIGSRNSNKFLRLYEKDLESKNKSLKDRVELVLKDDYATYEFASAEPIDNILSTYMSEIEFNTVQQEVWNGMQSDYCVISPKIKHKKTTLEEKTDYILRTYGGTLKAYAENKGTRKITEAIHESVYSNNDLRAIHNEKVLNMMRAKNRAKVVQIKAVQNAERAVEYKQLSMMEA